MSEVEAAAAAAAAASDEGRPRSVSGGVPQIGVNEETDMNTIIIDSDDPNNNNNKNNNNELDTVKVQRQIRAWYKGMCILQTCHSDFAYKYQWMDRFINAISVSLTAITSSVIFTSISPSMGSGDMPTDHVLAMVAGILAATNAVIQSLHRALGYAESAERHFLAHKQFTSMKFRLERLTCGNFGEFGVVVVDRIKLDEWANDYGKVLESAPIIPQAKFDEVKKVHKKKKKGGGVGVGIDGGELEAPSSSSVQNTFASSNRAVQSVGNSTYSGWTLNPLARDVSKTPLRV